MRRLLNAGSMVWLLATGTVPTQAARTQQGGPVDLLITRARVVETRSGAIAPGRVIAIRADTIVAIDDSTRVGMCIGSGDPRWQPDRGHQRDEAHPRCRDARALPRSRETRLEFGQRGSRRVAS